jgi:small subunit ribosomal protein S19
MVEEITKKQITYKGKTIDELKTLDVREFAKYLPSRERRSVLRNFQKIEYFIKRAKEKNEKGKKIKTHSRGLVIVPKLIGMNIQVHSGRIFVPVQIEPEMLGHRLGEMVPTRSKVAHSKAGVGATKGSKHKAKT